MSRQQPSVLQLISSSGLYGAERVLLELAQHLKQQGLASHVGALQHQGQSSVAVVRQARRLGLQTMLFPCRSGFDTRAMRHIRSYVVQHGIDVVHSHGYKSDIFLYLACGATRPLVSTCHNWLTDSPKLMVYELLDKLVLHRFDQVVGVSPALDAELRAAGIDHRRVIDNGLDLQRPTNLDVHAVRRELGLGPGQLMLLAIGRLDRWKAYDRLLQAVARLGQQATLVLVGDGELHQPLQEQARQLGLLSPDGVGQRVVFAGYRTDVGALLLSSDLFVISSRKEGLPMVLLEAMAAGLPIVATRVGAIPQALEEAGLLVPAEDPTALAGALQQLLDSPTLRTDLGRRALARHEARFSRHAMGRHYIELYRQLLSRGDRGPVQRGNGQDR